MPKPSRRNRVDTDDDDIYIPHPTKVRDRNLVSTEYEDESADFLLFSSASVRRFEQRVDHFDPSSMETWRQRYSVNRAHYRPGGPVFLMIGGESVADFGAVTEGGSWLQFAREVGAMCFVLEHRFYGESMPRPDFSVKNLAYLSVDQALADLAAFTAAMKTEHNVTDASWIAFGGSYPGSLAAWLRVRYPHLIDAAVSSSAPVQSTADFPGYLEVVSDVLDATDRECRPALEDAIHRLDKLLGEVFGFEKAAKKFGMCDFFDGYQPKNVAELVMSIMGIFKGAVQYNRGSVTVKALCDIMTGKTKSRHRFNSVIGTLEEKTTLDYLADVNRFYLDANFYGCFQADYMKEVQSLRLPTSTRRAWLYQTCTELGGFQTSSLAGSPYTDRFPLKFYEKQCADVFGSNFALRDGVEKRVAGSNVFFGGRDIRATKIVYVHGSWDPWHVLGVRPGDVADDDDATVILIEGASHCQDMRKPNPLRDSEALTQARETILSKIKEWIKN